MTIQRSEMLDETFGREYDAHPIKGLTRAEYVAKRYALAAMRRPLDLPRSFGDGRKPVSDFAWSK